MTLSYGRWIRIVLCELYVSLTVMKYKAFFKRELKRASIWLDLLSWVQGFCGGRNSGVCKIQAFKIIKVGMKTLLCTLGQDFKKQLWELPKNKFVKQSK